MLHNVSWTHEKAGRTREALDYAERYPSSSRGMEDEERAAKRVAFLKQRYGGGAATPAAEPVAAQTAQNAASGATANVGAVGRARAGGGALALAGVGCLAETWWTVSPRAICFTGYEHARFQHAALRPQIGADQKRVKGKLASRVQPHP